MKCIRHTALFLAVLLMLKGICLQISRCIMSYVTLVYPICYVTLLGSVILLQLLITIAYSIGPQLKEPP